MSRERDPLDAALDEQLWPVVEGFFAAHPTAGLAVAVVRDGDIASRCFGVRDVDTGQPVTPETTFHLASVSKPFVATAVVSLSVGDGEREPLLDLDAPVTDWIPELTLADGRAHEVTARGLLSHTSGLPDVSEYGWHEPQLDDEALSAFARSLSGWRLQSDPGTTFAYSNAGYELLGLLLARVTGMTFEDAMREHLLRPLGMTASTFRRADVPARLAASPHVAMPLVVPGAAYPYTRRHAPSSTLHSNLVELCRWVDANVGGGDAPQASPPPPRVPSRVRELMDRERATIGDPLWDVAQGLGWAIGAYRGRHVLSHSGADPGFGSRLVLLPQQGVGVVILANSNTVATSLIAQAALDVVLGSADEDDGPADPAARSRDGIDVLRSLLPPVVQPLAEVLSASGVDAATRAYEQLSTTDPVTHDLDDEGFQDAVWGAIELHRTDLVWPLLRLWTQLRPESSAAWTMTGWAHAVDGEPDRARPLLGRALQLDPDNDEAALILGNLPPD